MSVETQIIAALDRIAKGKQTSLAAYTGGTDFWDLCDAAQDETYENRVETATLTAVDTAVAAGCSWAPTAYKAWWQAHASYFSTDLGLTGSVLFQTYLESVSGRRMPYHAAEAHYEALNSRVTAARVFPKGTLPANEASDASSGMHCFGTFGGGALTGSDGALPTTCGPAAIMAVNQSAAQTVAGTFTCTHWVAATTQALALSLSGAAQYTQTILGQQALTSGAAAGQKVIPVGATAQFTVGEWVLVWESDALQEVGTVASKVLNTSVTVTSNLLKTYTSSAVLIPLFRSVAYASGASGSGNVKFYARPDRIIAL